MYDARELGIQVVKQSGNEQSCLCPFHEDHSPSASFNRLNGLFYCYVCNRGWNWAQLHKALGVSPATGYTPERPPPDANFLEEPGVLELGEEVYTPYFLDRGITPEVIAAYGVRWKRSKPEAAVLPCYTLQGRLTGVAYRYLVASPRYKMFGKPTPVWPMHLLAKLNQKRRMVLTEGAWSAMRIASVQGMEIVPLALLGAKSNQALVDLLRPFQVIFLYDADRAGEQACRKMRSLLPAAGAWTLRPSPDDMSDEEIRALFGKLESRW